MKENDFLQAMYLADLTLPVVLFPIMTISEKIQHFVCSFLSQNAVRYLTPDCFICRNRMVQNETIHSFANSKRNFT